MTSGDVHEPAPSPSGESAHGRPAWPALQAELARVGFRPSKRFGQNFLLDPNMVRAIVRDAAFESGADVVEIGAGLGFLTLELARAGARVLTVEVDERLARIAREILAREIPGHADRVRWIVGDALAGKHALAPELEAAIGALGTWHLVSNLPYSAAGPVLVLCTLHAHPPASITVLVQREVAARIAARPGSDAWGPLSIRLQFDYEPAIVRAVPAGLFWPRPDVESAVVRLVRRPDPLPRGEREDLSQFVGVLFQHRRQTLGRTLSDLAGDRARAAGWLARAGRAARERAEDLDLGALRALARARSDPP